MSDYEHEVQRILQFQKEAKDDQQFRQKILLRATRCGPAKRDKFISTLKRMGRQDLASFIQLTFSP